MRGGQLGLLLWKNYVVRKRRPAILSLVFLWPVAVFLLLYTVRDNVDPEYNPTCQFPARLMPHDGLLPFLQSYICSIGNTCGSLDDYEEVPSYKNATLGPLMMELQMVLTNDTMLSAVKTLPKSIQFLKSMAQILTKPEIKKLFDRGIRLGDLFNNHEAIKSLLRAHMPEAEDTLIDGLLNASIKLYYLIETFGSSNLDGVICTPDLLKKYLVLEKEKDLLTVSKVLCNVDTSKIPDILGELTNHLDFIGLLEMVSRVTAKFNEYDFIDDLVRALNAVLNLETVKKYVPSYLKIQEWLPKIVALFRDVNFKEIDVTLITKAVETLDPIFASERDWPTARHGLQKLNNLLVIIKDVFEKKNSTADKSSRSAFEISNDLAGNMAEFITEKNNWPDVTKILDACFLVLQDGIKLTNKLLDRHRDQLVLATEVLDGLKNFFPKNIVNSLTYLVSMTDNVIKITHHVAIIHEEINERLYNVSIKHQEIVKNILTTINPDIYWTVIESISNLNFTEQLVTALRTNESQEVLCQEDVLNEITQGYKDFNGKSSTVRDLLCSDTGKAFVADAYDSFEFKKFTKNVDDTLMTFVSMALRQPVKIERSNLTTLVTSARDFVIYLANVSPTKPNWSTFDASEKWREVFRDTRIKTRVAVLGVHLSIAKDSGTRSLSYFTIKPDLEYMDFIADLILTDLQNNPTDWIAQVRKHEAELVESFYLTVADRNKTLKILEYSNFTASYCTNQNSSEVVNYPVESNATLLKGLVCRLARSVQVHLDFNKTEFDAHNDPMIAIMQAAQDRSPFDWTLFNGKLLEIYEYIESLLPQVDEQYDEKRLKSLKENFAKSWTKDLSIRDAWEISVGFLCKIFDVAESPLFNVKSNPTWNALYPVARATAIIANTIERVVDQLRLGNGTAKLSNVVRDLPQTEILLDTVLRNLGPLTIDVMNIVTVESPVRYLTLIKDYMEKEIFWPCVYNTSLGGALGLSFGSRQIVREIERVSCNPDLFIDEWKKHPAFGAVQKVFEKDPNTELSLSPAFNWTQGYGRFRVLVGKIESLVNSPNDVILTDDQGTVLHSKSYIPNIKKIIEDNMPIVENKAKTIFDDLDIVLEKNIDALISNKTAAEVWKANKRNRNFDDILVIAKFSTRVIHEFVRFFIDTLDHSKSVSLIKLMGFTNRSAVSVIHERIPYIFAMIINGISDPAFETRVYNETVITAMPVTCGDVFRWFGDYRIGLTVEEYRIIEDTTCHADPEYFNAFTDIVINLIKDWNQPVSKYRSHIFSLAEELYELANIAADISERGVEFELPFTQRYFENIFNTLKNTLAISKPMIVTKLSDNLTFWTFRLTIEGLSRCLDHAITALKDPKLKDKVTLHTWDFAGSGDVRQLIKLLESHPNETIALAANLAIINSTTHKPLSFDDVHREMCVSRFNSSYWLEQSRKRFLDEVCMLDPHQLLRSLTGDDFYNAVVNGATKLQHVQPLSRSVMRFINAVTNLRTPGGERKRVVSNIFNATTWLALPDEPRNFMRKAQRSWAVEMALPAIPSSKNLLQFMQWEEIIRFMMEISEGGDVWAKLKTKYESPKAKAIIALIEDSPNIMVTTIDTFVTSERLSDFVEKFMDGRASGCDFHKFLIPSPYIRHKGFLATVENFCEKIIRDESEIYLSDILPMGYTLENILKSWNKYTSRTVQILHKDESFVKQENYVVQELEMFESTLARLSNGNQIPLKMPLWWTSFEAGTYVDFVKQYDNKDLKQLIHSVITKSTKVLRDLLTTSFGMNCNWCNGFIVQIVNSQLSHHEIYSKLVCDINRLNFSRVTEIFEIDLNWPKTIDMIRHYDQLSNKPFLHPFIDAVHDTLYYISDIIIDYEKPSNGQNLTECLLKAMGAAKNSGTGLYVKSLMGLLDYFQRNIHILDTAINHDDIRHLTGLAETFVPIWKPLRDVVASSDIVRADKLLPNATINVNLLVSERHDSPCPKGGCNNPSELQAFLSTKRSTKFLRYDPKAANYPSVPSIAKFLAESLDLKKIDSQIKTWRKEAGWNLDWLKNLLINLNVILEEGGNLLNVASLIDFSDVSSALGAPDVADGVISLIKDKTIDKLFDGLNELVDDVEPFLADDNVRRDLRTIVETFENMEIFKNLGLLDMKYVVSEMFTDWNTLRRFLVEKINIPEDVADILSKGKIDMLSVFMKERKAISLKDTVCSPKKLGDMLSLETTKTSIEEVSAALCTLDDAATQNVTVVLIQNLNFDYIFSTLMSANVKNILKNANLTDVEGQVILDNLGVVAELVPFFKDKLSSGFSMGEIPSDADSTEKISSGKFLQDTSKMMCGKALITESGDFYRVISSIQDKKKSFDQKELDSLPTEFCKETYKNVLSIIGGKIIWSYVKPLLRGQILYAPNTTSIDRVMGLANETFSQMGSFGDLMNAFEQTLRSLANLTDMGESLNDLKDIMASKVMKIAIKSMSNGGLEGDFSDFDLGEIAWKIKRSGKLTEMVGMLNNFMDCVLVDRVRGFTTENEMEKEARRLTDANEFLAGVVFLQQSTRSERSVDVELPEDIVYKIRMDVDYVPTTKRLKTQFWIPGPEANFLEDLRYQRGFIQLQDSIDRAIIKEKTGKIQNWKTVTQQMPYPCWKHTPFIATLYESQGVQVCFFFALMMCVGSAVRYIVWERESQNSMIMSVMGLKPWRNTVAWFVTTYIELTIVMISICIILIAGKILPRSDPLLVLILLLDYVFSIVTFCYMISTMFSSASLAAVTSVVMFLLTYMPYVIVIAMEAAMSFGWKLFICLSMSTSFSYGLLYTVRREVQGLGLTWDTMWEETSPGDPMSLGLILVMIALDGIIYAVIGYFVARYTNSGRDFRGLRSRSLWWAETRSLYGRPSYLGFVNSLYFTNDVLHSSATYQDDDSDPGSMIVNEKQIGVRFESVRKVFHSEKGEIVAVDDFTMKLCEGEVTSLLGRNGAGKTTIIKMLTGMTAPTNGQIYLNGDEGTKPDIGVCPQDNVLIDTLTPREHMTFYARLKRPTDDAAMLKNVNTMLASLELGRQEHEPVHRLSGGTKRRLCVALAFLGSPKLVILDEPGAGVDPAARRRIWRLIDQHRVDRTVLLSTHHLDEADMLSDTVIVMHRGKILCTGSPLSLKTTYGHGYWLHVEFPLRDNLEQSVERKNIENLRSMMENVIPNATMKETSDSELIIALPFQGKHGEANDISKAAKVLEDNKKCLGFSHISLECDTLERVFLDVCSRADTGSAAVRVSMDSVASVGSIGYTIPTDDVDLMIGEPAPNPKPLRQAKALLKKRLWHFAKDWRAPLATLVLPTMFVAVAMGFSLIRPPSGDEPPLDLNPKLYDTHPTFFYSIDNGSDVFLRDVSQQLHNRFGGDYAGAWQTHPNDTGTCDCTEGQHRCYGVSKAVEGLFQTLPGRPTLDWIISTFHEYIEKRYGGWSLSHAKEDPLFVVWYNNKGHHALPAYVNALNAAILRASGIPGNLKTLNHPLKLSRDQLNRTTLVQHVADVGVALVLLIAFSLVAAQGARELVRERLSEEKRILYLAGVHPVTYWTTALIWDFLIFLCSILLAVIVFEIFGLSAYVAKDNLSGVCLILVLFAWAAIPFTHLVEKAFDDASLSNMVLFCLNTFVGVACLATILIIDILGKSQASKDTRKFLHHILMFFPQYALGDALVQITTNDITAELLGQFQMDTYKSPLGWELIGLHYLILFIVGIVFYAANLVIECGFVPDWPKSRISYEKVSEDEDVMRERLRVEDGGNNDVIQTVRLRKEYRSVYGKNVAVQSLSVGVEAGSCFGLLGVNGAGKSSTFRMLTTETRPTAGQIVLKGEQIGRRPLCNGEVGYCPQSDSLDGFLSPHQCLTIHGEICGLDDVSRAVETMLKRFDLTKYAHQRVSSLSGGNKRKLCAAISVMSPVSLVLMDEPTSGMDPASKELVARAVRFVNRNQTCVVMTSHSASDCEKLCNRVGILAKAGLRCIGTVQHLKHKYGEGYVAFLRFGLPVSPKDLKEAIARHLPTTLISSRQAMAARLLVPRANEGTLSSTFDKVRQLAEELKATDYTLTQSSLDQVLVNFSEELEDDNSDPRYEQKSRAVPNAYSNIQDTIHMETF